VRQMAHRAAETFTVETPANAWLCVCGLTVKKRYTCLCGGREENSTSDRQAETVCEDGHDADGNKLVNGDTGYDGLAR